MEKKLSSTSGAAKRRKLKDSKATLAKLPKLTKFLKQIEEKLETKVDSSKSHEVVNQSIESKDIEENIANKNVIDEDLNNFT